MKDGTPTEELQNIIKLYVDDVRDAPDSTWNVERTFHGAICFLENHNVHTVSLDHDLACFYGTREMTGRDILNWLIARIYEGKHTPTVVKVHSANVAASPAMEADIARYFKGTQVADRPLPLDVITDALQERIHIQKGNLLRSTPVKRK